MMKFSLKTPEPVADSEGLSEGKCIEMLEAAILDIQGDKHASELMDVETSFLQLAAAPSVKDAVESLSDTEKTELAEVFNCSTESLATMKQDEFLDKIEANLPIKAAMVEAGQEDAVLGVIALAYFACIFFAIAAAIANYYKERAMIEAIWRKLESAFTDGDKNYLDDIVVHCWKAPVLQKALASCDKVASFLHQDMRKIFEESTKLQDIEKLAVTLWACDMTYIDVEKDPDSKQKWYTWWGTWKNKAPDVEGGSLRDLGFTTKSLEECSKLCSKQCVELLKIKEIAAEANKAKREHDRDVDPGLWGRIKRWFTESKEQKQERLQKEYLVSLKFQALKNLIWGYKTTVREAANTLYVAAIKGDKILRKLNKNGTKA